MVTRCEECDSPNHEGHAPGCAALELERALRAGDAEFAQLTELDGPAFALASMPLPKDHWIYEPTGEPPMPFRVGLGPDRGRRAEQIREAVKYAVRAATMNGTARSDPAALMQNMIVGLLGYWTEDGRSHG